MRDIERIFAEHNRQTMDAFSSNLKSQIVTRLLKIQSKQQAAAIAKTMARPYSTLVVGGSDISRGGSGDEGYGYDDEERDEDMKGLTVPGLTSNFISTHRK